MTSFVRIKLLVLNKLIPLSNHQFHTSDMWASVYDWQEPHVASKSRFWMLLRAPMRLLESPPSCRNCSRRSRPTRAPTRTATRSRMGGRATRASPTGGWAASRTPYALKKKGTHAHTASQSVSQTSPKFGDINRNTWETITNTSSNGPSAQWLAWLHSRGWRCGQNTVNHCFVTKFYKITVSEIEKKRVAALYSRVAKECIRASRAKNNTLND